MSPWLTLFEHAPDWSTVGGAVAVAIVVAWGVAELLTRLAARAIPRRTLPDRPGMQIASRRLIRLLRLGFFLVFIVIVLPPILELFGEPVRTGLRVRTVGAWALAGGLRLLFIVVIALVLAHIIGISTNRFQQYVVDSQGPSAEQLKRSKTVGGLVQNVARAFIFAAAGVMILNELHIDTQPLLAGAGIVGLGSASARRRW